ncbi:MAG: histidine phosphatase family protein [Sphingobium sp.]
MAGFDLHLMRHGAPETPGLMMGRTDCVPIASGVAACVRRGAALDMAAVASSDLMRAERPARAIVAERGLTLTIDARWRELDFGEWDGLAPRAIDSAALGRFWTDPDEHAPPGGERWSSLLARVGTAIEELAAVPTLVVTHGGAMRAAIAHLCGLSVGQTWALDLPYCALLSLRVWEGERRTAQIVALTP